MTAAARVTVAGSRPPNGVLGALLVVASESMFFVGLAFAALQIRRTAPIWPPEGSPTPEPWLVVSSTAVLVASSLTAHAAMRAVAAGKLGYANRAIAATLFLGTSFLLGQVVVFQQLGGWRPADGVYATLFQILAGFHGLHAAVGLLLFLWLFVLGRARGARQRAGSFAAAAAGAAAPPVTPAFVTAVYWHFVTAVWLAIVAVWLLP